MGKKCQKCHEKCDECVGPFENDCTVCNGK